MEQLRDLCDETNKIKSKSKYFQNLTQNKFEKRIRILHTKQNHDFFDRDELYNKDIYNHKKNDLYQVKSDFKLNFYREFPPPIKSELRDNITIL